VTIVVSGAAHGMAGILQVLLSFPAIVGKDKKNVEMLREAVDFMVDRCMEDGNIPTNLNGVLNEDGKYLVHWCHGASGRCC